MGEKNSYMKNQLKEVPTEIHVCICCCCAGIHSSQDLRKQR